MSLFNWKAPTTADTQTPTVETYRVEPSDLWRSRREKVNGNLRAIQTLRQLTFQQPLTTDQQRDLARYQGWGLCADLFRIPPPAEWHAEAELLTALLTPEEYASARNSVNTAFYTPPALIQCMFQLLQHMGFEGGTVLEPGCGSGLYMGLTPPELTIQWSGVEREPLASAIAARLYPNATLYQQAMERVTLPLNHFDAAIGNVPYSAQPPFDRQFKDWALTGIHDYFIAKTVRALRPGGLFPCLTSVGTLQSRKGQAFREQLDQWARLVCAFKLPMGTFSQFSFTAAACDLLVLQRLRPGEVGNGGEWVGVVESPVLNPETQLPLSINPVFLTQPEWVLGSLGVDRMYGGVRLGVQPDGDLYKRLEQCLEALPVGVYSPQAAVVAAVGDRPDSLPLPPDLQHIKPYSYLWYAEEPWQCREGRLERVKVVGKKRLRLRYLIMIRDALNQVLQVQWESDDEETLRQAQQRLDQVYRQYVVNHGWLHEAGNSVFSSDPDYPLLLALELWNPDNPSQTKQTDIFTQRTVNFIPTHTTAETALEGLVCTLAECGRVDLDFLQGLYPHPLTDIIAELQPAAGPLIFRDPEQQEWVPAEEYLSGDVRQKLRAADAAAKDSPAFLVNVTALKAVQPVDLEPKQIFARLGSPWLPTDVIEAFIAHLLQITPNDKAFDTKRVKTIHVTHSVRLAAWTVSLSGAGDNILNTSEYGTSRVSAVRLIELALNQQIPEVYDYTRDSQVKNRVETRRALVKQEKVKESFRRWVWSDWRRAERLCDLYNRDYNCFRRRRFNGQHLKGYLKGVSKQWQERLEDPARAYQLDQIWRGITDGNMLSKVPTGGGKTAIAICILQELKRHRQCTKPALVVMDQLVLQQAAEAAQIYPGLQILTISSRNIDSATKRRELVARAATGNWDLVVISHTAFKMMPLKAQTISKITNGELDLIRNEYKDKGLNGKRGMKQLEKKTDKAQGKLDASLDGIARDTVFLEDTGIDYVAYDESQETLLGLATETEMRGVLGISNANSDIARDFYYKTRYLAGLHGEGKGVILLTATPVRNTLGQAWVNLVYLCPKRLEARGLRPFDGFISAFSEPRVGVEITAAGTMEVKTRLASWSNFTEFKQLWWSVVDVVREAELDINKPKATYHIAEVPASSSQLAFFEHVVGRATLVRDRQVEPRVDNYPKITSDVKRGVIHPLLLRHSELRCFLDADTIAGLKHEHTKVDQATADTYQEWLKYKDERLTQLLFLDNGTPNADGRFTTYDLIKESLVARGVPASEIAYAHDAHTDEQKADLFRRFRQGVVRILIGSTKRLGVGSHFPDRLRVVRCIDVPMRPSDILQRIGRMVRPGNQNSEVEVWNYITVGKPYTTAEGTVAGLSPDAYFFGVVQMKARFIDAMDEENEERVVQDIDEAGSLDFGLLIATASGDPRFKRKVELDAQAERLLSEEQDWQTQRIFLERRLHNLQRQIEEGQVDLTNAQAAVDTLVDTQGKQFQMTLTLNGRTQTYTKRETAGQVLQLAAEQCRAHNTTDIAWVGTLSGFLVGVSAETETDHFSLYLATAYRTYLAEATTPLGACRSLEDKLKKVREEPALLQDELAQWQAERERSLSLQQAPFALEAELKSVLDEQEALAKELGIKSDDVLDAVAAA